MPAVAIRHKHVLVVDDDAAIRTLESFLLQRDGYDVAQAGDGAQAIAHLDRHHADLVLLDLLMPGVDGWAVLERVVRLEHPPRVVIVSGVAEVDTPPHLALHVCAVLAKPFAPAELLTACEDALAER